MSTPIGFRSRGCCSGDYTARIRHLPVIDEIEGYCGIGDLVKHRLDERARSQCSSRYFADARLRMRYLGELRDVRNALFSASLAKANGDASIRSV
jgi:hypothetical protein